MTPKEQEYVLEYLTNGYNATQAYMKVYKTSKVSCKAYEILKRPEAKEYISSYRKNKLDALNVDNDRILERLTEIAFTEKGDKYYKPAEQLKALEMIYRILTQDKQTDDKIIHIKIDDKGSLS